MIAKSTNLQVLLDKIEEIIADYPDFMNNASVAEQLTKLMREHPLAESDWLPYSHFDAHKYTRNLIASGRGNRFGLMVLAWGAGQASPIHDHAESHCVMRVLEGRLVEELYAVREGKAELERQSELVTGGVAYIHDRIGWHRVRNASPKEKALSLHLYAPPIEACRTVDEAGQRIRAKAACPYYSKYGRVIQRKLSENKQQ